MTLKVLNLAKTGVSFSNIGSPTCTLPMLEELDLTYCWNMTDSSIMGVLNKVGGKLKGLHLTGTGVSFSDIGCLTSSLPALEILNLARCKNLTDFGLVAFLNKAWKTLTVLDLRGTGVSLSEIGSLTSTLPSLEELNLEWCLNLTDSSIVEILNQVGMTLKVLNLAKTGVSFSNIGSLTCTLPSLEELYLEGCLNLTDSSIMELLNKFGEKLKVLDLSKTKVSFSNIGSLSGSFPVLEDLNLKHCLSLKDERLMTFLGKTSENLRLILSPSCNVDVNAIKAAFPHIQIKLSTF